jgi:hypothetical protein
MGDRRSDCQSMQSIAILAADLARLCAGPASLIAKLPCVAKAMPGKEGG